MLLFLLCIGILPMHAAWCFCGKLPYPDHRFLPKDDNPTQFEKEMLQKEYENYKNLMNRRGTKYKILHEDVQPNGAIVVDLKKQNNLQAIGYYFD